MISFYGVLTYARKGSQKPLAITAVEHRTSRRLSSPAHIELILTAASSNRFPKFMQTVRASRCCTTSNLVIEKSGPLLLVLIL